MTQPGSTHRISLSLDTRIALESLVLNRLQRLPETRREEWLRGLVICGFRGECQAIKAQQSKLAAKSDDARLQTPFSHWLIQGPTRKQPKTHEAEVPGGHLPNEPGHSKPFAALRKVIG